MSTARSAPSSTTSLHGVLHFEGKIWHTLPLLAWRPGELTRRYIDGQRAQLRFADRAVPLLRFPDVRAYSASPAARTAATLGDNRDLARTEKEQAADIVKLQESRASRI